MDLNRFLVKKNRKKKRKNFFRAIISFYPSTIYFCHNFSKIYSKSRSFWSFHVSCCYSNFKVLSNALICPLLWFFRENYWVFPVVFFFCIVKSPKSRIPHLRCHNVIHLTFSFIYVQICKTVLSFKKFALYKKQ